MANLLFCFVIYINKINGSLAQRTSMAVQLTARTAMPQDDPAWGRVGVGPKPCRGARSYLILYHVCVTKQLT